MAEKQKIVSKDFEEYLRGPNPDTGLDESIKSLKSEEIENTIKAVIGKQSARITAVLDTCIHCGLCSEACQWYLSNDKDPTYAPVAKMRMTIWEMIKRNYKVDAEFIKQCARIVFTECNICHRCSMYCPYGLDITFIIGMVRRICFLLGVVPQRMMDQNHSHATTLSQVWFTQNDWIDTMQWQEEEVGAEFKDLRIPIDKEGAEVMWMPLGAEPKTSIYHIERHAKIMNWAGVDWTVPGRDGWDCSNMAMFLRDFTTQNRIVRGLFENAARLRIKKFVMTECGHSRFASTYAAPPMLGWKDLPFKMYQSIEFFHELLMEGRIKIARKIKEPVTIHDPCNLVRRAGATEKFREMAYATCEKVIEMYPNWEHNFCCNAGGGLASLSNWTAHKAKGNRVKAEQIKATGAKLVITSCHNCSTGISDIIKYYGLNVKNVYFDEILTETMEIPKGMKVNE
jgi:Fe-S oxidoreductase